MAETAKARRSAEQIASDELEKAQKRVQKAEDRLAKARAEEEKAEADLVRATRYLAFAESNPDLPDTDAPELETEPQDV
jgi:multidrug efflux pump subunit AcrA (membrane-fusion protein)